MTVSPNSAFFTRLQDDGIEIVELIDLALPNGVAFHWTTGNQRLTYTLSGAATDYLPFAGKGGADFSEGIQLSVAAMNFTIANSGADLQQQLLSEDFAQAQVHIGQVFTDTPDLGRLPIYYGRMGDFTFTRQELTGQARNLWKSLNIQWPYYTFADNCGWRFGSVGCGVNVASYTATGSVVVGSSTVFSLLLPAGTLSNSFADGRMNFGRLTITGGANSGSIRPIMTQVGDLITLAQPLSYAVLSGTTVSIRPGCMKRLIQDCKSTYNNETNYLGWPWMVKEADAY